MSIRESSQEETEFEGTPSQNHPFKGVFETNEGSQGTIHFQGSPLNPFSGSVEPLYLDGVERLIRACHASIRTSTPIRNSLALYAKILAETQIGYRLCISFSLFLAVFVLFHLVFASSLVFFHEPGLLNRGAFTDFRPDTVH